MWKFLLVLLIFWWVLRQGRRAWRLLGRTRPPVRRQEKTPGKTGRRGRLSHLTQQEISDADFEEIPEEE